MMAYADYSYYQETYKGAVVPAALFDGLSIRATWYIDSLIRTHQDEPVEAVKMACCAVTEAYYFQQQSAGISSETVGKHSVTYRDSTENRAQLYEAAYAYLCNTGLLYRGVILL